MEEREERVIQVIYMEEERAQEEDEIIYIEGREEELFFL